MKLLFLLLVAVLGGCATPSGPPFVEYQGSDAAKVVGGMAGPVDLFVNGIPHAFIFEVNGVQLKIARSVTLQPGINRIGILLDGPPNRAVANSAFGGKACIEINALPKAVYRIERKFAEGQYLLEMHEALATGSSRLIYSTSFKPFNADPGFPLQHCNSFQKPSA